MASVRSPAKAEEVSDAAGAADLEVETVLRVTPIAAWIGRLATWPSRTLTTMASMKIAA